MKTTKSKRSIQLLKVICIITFTTFLFSCQSANNSKENELMQKENELMKKENELLLRENELLKKEQSGNQNQNKNQAQKQTSSNFQSNVTSQIIERAFLKSINRIEGSERDSASERYCYVVNILVGDLNQDGLKDGLVHYACGFKAGGNARAGSGWAVMINDNGSLFLLLTDEEINIVPSKITSDGTIIGEQLDYAPSDPRCCPSIKTPRNVKLLGNSLIVVK